MRKEWAPAEDAKLARMWATGASLPEVAVALGRTANSCALRRQKIGLPRRRVGPNGPEGKLKRETSPSLNAGARFNFLTSTGRSVTESGRPLSVYICDCGREVALQAGHVEENRQKSCGCMRGTLSGAANVTHGGVGLPEYEVWCGIKKRCFNVNTVGFDDYGGRGVTVCDRWRDSFEAFLADMGTRPSSDHTIERIDNDGDYTPSNCRWALRAEQNANKRNTVRVTVDGIEMCLAVACRKLGLHYGTVYTRIKELGWPQSRALSS